MTDYDLVRIYHPDSPVARAGGVPPETAHARFQAISAAYAVLTGKKTATSFDGGEAGESLTGKARASYHDLSTAMWRERQRRKADLDVGLDERWKERLMLGAILLVRLHGPLSRTIPFFSLPFPSMLMPACQFASVQTVAMFVYQTYTTRTRAMAESRPTRRSNTRSLEAQLHSDDFRLELEVPPTGSTQRDPS